MKAKLVCPINPEHKQFRMHFFELYDSDTVIDENCKEILDNEVDIQQVYTRNHAARVCHCIRCDECTDNDIEWDDETFQKFQKDAEKAFGHKSTSMKLINQIMDIVEGALPENCPDCHSSIFSIDNKTWRCEDQRTCGWSKEIV